MLFKLTSFAPTVSLWTCSPFLRLYSPHVPLRQTISQGLYVLLLAIGLAGSFTEADLKTPLPKKLTFTDPEKIRELARRGEAWGDSESRQMLEGAIEQGRGGVYLMLTPDQYAKLRRR